MPGLLQRFLPREEGFFDLFAKQASNIHVGAEALHKMLSHYTGVPEQVQIVKAIEHEGDEITHALFTKLNQTFITPFDREDIYELCSRLDDVIDLIDAAASRFVLYRVDTIRIGTIDLVKVLVSATVEVELAIRALEKPQEALKHAIEINRYENDSDRLCRTLIAQLFDEEKDPVQIIKWKEIFEVIETAVDKCEDVANVIATVVSTRVLTPFRAVVWAAFWNFIAAFVFGTAVAKTIGKGMVRIELVDEKVLLAGLLGAITWNLITLVLGLTTSSSHALMGGYGGAAVAHAGFKALILGGWTKPVLFIFLSPVIGLVVAVAVTILTSWIVRRQRPLRVDRWFRRLQLLSAAGYSLGHGTNDAQKGMGIITTALVAGGLMKTYDVPYWVILCCHLAMAGGTMAGGWRIIKTMGQRITKLTPFGGFAAETAGGLTLVANAVFGIPVSTTHTITGAIVGVGATRRLPAGRWGVTRRIVYAWILTIPGAALFGATLFRIITIWIR